MKKNQSSFDKFTLAWNIYLGNVILVVLKCISMTWMQKLHGKTKSCDDQDGITSIVAEF